MSNLYYTCIAMAAYNIVNSLGTNTPTFLLMLYSSKASEQKGASSLFDDIETDTSERLKLGQRVFHQKFGEGVVLNYEGQGRHARVQVNFENTGSKWLVMEYANLVVTA